MTPEQHEAKAARIELSLRKCAPEHYEIAIEGAMLAASQWFNLALHRMGFTRAEQDVLHAEYLTGDLRLKLKLFAPEVLDSMDALEAARPFYVRGDLPDGAAVAREALEHLDRIRAAASAAKPFGRK